MRGVGIAGVYADIGCVRIFVGQFPEWMFDDARRIFSDAQFQKQQTKPLMAVEKVLIAGAGLIPSLVLYKGIVTAQVHGHGPAAEGTVGHKPGRYTHILLFGDHTPYGFLVVIGDLMTGLGALPETIIPLRIKQPPFVKTRLLKAVVNVRHYILQIVNGKTLYVR